MLSILAKNTLFVAILFVKIATIERTLCQLPEDEERLQALLGATPPFATPTSGSKRDKWSHKANFTEDFSVKPNMEGSSLSSILYQKN